jgi:hypothetical protein
MTLSAPLVLSSIAVAASLFFGFKACEIFGVPWPRHWAGRLYLFWFNFSGSLLGWAALAVLCHRLLPCFSGTCSIDLGVSTFALALVAFAGVTGHIPMATMGIFRALANLAQRIFSRWFGAAD